MYFPVMRPYTQCAVCCCSGVRIRGRLVREANYISPLGFSAALYPSTVKDARNGIVRLVFVFEGNPLLLLRI